MATKITVRFNTGKAADKRALEYLQTAGISYSKAVVKAINAYLDLQTEEARKVTVILPVCFTKLYP